MKPRRSMKIEASSPKGCGNEPELPEFTAMEKLTADNEILARAISKLRFHNLIVGEFLSEEAMDVIKRYAK